MLIIHPPLTKPCEPPAALAHLQAILVAHDHPCHVIDMNIEGLHYLLEHAKPENDTWSKRAFKAKDKNIDALRAKKTYSNIDRYRRAVSDLNRLLENEGRRFDLQLSFGNYVDQHKSPLKSSGLLLAAEQFSENIFYPYFSSKLNELIHAHRVGNIGFSLSYLSQALCTFSMIGFLKTHHPEIKIILGGGLVTTWLSNKGWQDPFTDLVDTYICGKGEAPLLKHLNIVEKVKQTIPSYADLFKNDYLSPGFILPYSTSSGCFWKKCSFCPEKTENNPYSHCKPETTITELGKLSKQTSPALIHFLDNALSPSTTKALCENPQGVPWYGFARFSQQLHDKDFCFSLKKSGCVMLKLGLESGNQKVLDKMQKGIDLELVSQALTNLQAAGIATYVYLLFGTPAETEEEAHETLDFVEKHHNSISFLNLAIFNLPICSVETSQLEISQFYDGDLSIYRNFTHPEGWNRKQVRIFLDTIFKRSPHIAEILRRDAPFFTSNHAPFFNMA